MQKCGKKNSMKQFEFTIRGSIRGGKNSILINRTGHRYPNPVWAKWRDEVVAELKRQQFIELIEVPCSIQVKYTPYDRKRRDTPAMLDSIYHCLERAGIVADDCLIKNVSWVQFPLDKEKAGVEIVIEELG